MDLRLIRKLFRPDGIFSSVTDLSGKELFVTLEHAYFMADGFWKPKIPNGTYVCVRGTHQLKNGGPFETFEITGVPGHSGLLFHCGNFDQDSEGCVLTGKTIAQDGEIDMVTHSRDAFAQFMSLQTGLDFFPLSVVG